MRFLSTAVTALAIGEIHHAVGIQSGTSTKRRLRGNNPAPLLEEDQQFWKSLLEQQESMSIPFDPSPPPTPAPTPPVTPAPTRSPSTEPSVRLSDVPTVVSSAEPTMELTTIEPTIGPTAEPTTVPSIEPTIGPSAEPTSVPSAVPTNSLSAEPTSSLSEEPTSIPTVEQTSSPVAPTAGPSAVPTAVETASPTSSPSLRPSISGLPSLEPSPLASESPSASPSASPSIAPTTEVPTQSPASIAECEVDLEVNCVDMEGNDCSELAPIPAVCTEQPDQLVMQYNGGGCDQSANTQPPVLFQCFDNAGGPPLEGEVYIEAFDATGLGIEYFNGIVNVGESFALGSAENPLQADTSIVIRREIEGTPLQLLTFHTSCAGNLFLKDRYGATQVLQWTNEEQGTVNCFKNVTYNYFIMNDGEEDAALVSLVSDINGETIDLTDEVRGEILSPGEDFLVPVQAELDLTNRMTYIVDSAVTAVTEIGNECEDADQLIFDAGTPLPPSVPTPAPISIGSGSPTSSFAPTSTAEETVCSLGARVSCNLKNGVPCNALTTVPEEDLICDDRNPIGLGWFYRGTGCDDTTTNQAITCTDFNGGPNTDDEVEIQIFGANIGQPYFTGNVSVGELIFITSGTPLALDLRLSVTITGGDGEVLQEMSFDTACREEDDLTIGKIFGGLELASYRTNEKFVQGFEEVEWTFSLQNTGPLDAELVSTTATINGEPVIVLPPDLPERITLESGESYERRIEYVIDLVESETYSSIILAVGQAVGGLGCGSTAFQRFVVI